MNGGLGSRRGPLDGMATHPLIEVRPPAAIWICDGGAPPDAPRALLLPVAPGRWWVVHEGSATSPPPRTTDVSHGMTRLRIEGSEAEELLSTGIPLDLHPATFGVDEVAATAFRSVFVVVHRRGADGFDLYTQRSSAQSLWEWLVDAAAGCGQS